MSKLYFVFISFATLLAACSGQPENKPGSEADEAAVLYSNNCVSCHGTDGRKGLAGAKDLSASQLPESGVIQIIRNGSPSMGMPGFGQSLSEAQLKSLAVYVMKLRG
jgi:mono/diheme cytochrome c family protein